MRRSVPQVVETPDVVRGGPSELHAKRDRLGKHFVLSNIVTDEGKMVVTEKEVTMFSQQAQRLRRPGLMTERIVAARDHAAADGAAFAAARARLAALDAASRRAKRQRDAAALDELEALAVAPQQPPLPLPISPLDSASPKSVPRSPVGQPSPPSATSGKRRSRSGGSGQSSPRAAPAVPPAPTARKPRGRLLAAFADVDE